MKTTLAKRRKFFDEKREVISSQEVRFSCPCCGYPTISERGHYDICQICNWEDDGRDDSNADDTGGPNHHYSLREARINFEKYLVMYPPEKDTRIGGADSENVLKLKRKLIETFDKMLERPSSEELTNLWLEVKKIKKALRRDLINRIRKYEDKIMADRKIINSKS